MRSGRGLEARYRRLLAWFPREHRQVHGEEMAGVLLAAARPGQERPGRAESLNLMLSGVRIRLRPGGALTDQDGWGDTLAVFCIVMPVLLFVATVAVQLTDRALIGWWGNPRGMLTALIIAGQLLLVPPVLLGLRRWAIAAAAGPLALFGFLIMVNLSRGLLGGPLAGTYVMFGSYVVVAGGLELVALLASPGPRRGMQLLRGRRWAYAAASVVPTTVVMAAPHTVILLGPLASAETPVGVIAGIAVIALSTVWLSSALGKRLAVLFAALASTYLAAAALSLPAGLILRAREDSNLVAICLEVAIAVLAVVAVRRVRHRSRP